MASFRAGNPSESCFGYIDGTLRPICRPGETFPDQQAWYNGRKHIHGTQFQAIAAPNGMLIHLSEGFVGSSHDQSVLQQSSLLQTLDILDYPDDDDECYYHLFGDKGYFIRGRILTPLMGNNLTAAEKMYNAVLAELRVCVENLFKEMTQQWRHITDKATQKILQTPVMQEYIVASFLVNCRACFYGNQVSIYFNCQPPGIDEYLSDLQPNI